MRRRIITAFAFCVLAPALFAQEKTVVPITKLSLYGPFAKVNFGSGFCLDPECRFIVTNYHVAEAMGKRFSIQREPVVSSWLDSGPDDQGATELGYNPLHDLAIVELWHGLAKKGFHGVDYNTTSVEDLVIGQDVDIYSYPLESNPKRKLLHFKGKYIGMHKDGLLVFSYEPDPQDIRGGASGGMVVDSAGRVIAVLSERAVNEKIILGVPMEVLSAFVSKVQPYLAQRLFPQGVFVPPVRPDLYPIWIPERVSADELQKRPIEPPDVQLLRDKAQTVVDNMRTLIAVQSYEWGKGSATSDPQAIAAYEVMEIEGHQRFREYPDGKREMKFVPPPGGMTSITPGDSWLFTPQMVAKEHDLQIRRMPDTEWNGQKLRVFQFFGAKEDDVCRADYGGKWTFYGARDIEAYDCYGEVWTDQDENIVRLSTNYHLSRGWYDYREEVTFMWIEINGVRSLVPATMSCQATLPSLFTRKTNFVWCRGIFTDYRQFQTETRFVSSLPM